MIRYGTPVNGIILSSVGIVCLVSLSFTEIISLVNFLYCFAELIEFIAFLKLRLIHTDIERPFKIPVGTVGAFIFMFPTIVFIVIVLIIADPLTYTVCGIIIFVGLCIPSIMGVLRRRNICKFINVYEEMDYEPPINLSCFSRKCKQAQVVDVKTEVVNVKTV